MEKYIQLQWDSQFATRSSIFEPLRLLADKFSDFKDAWPGLDDYQQVLEAHPELVLTQNGQPLKIVKQERKPTCFEEHYAPRIYLTGEIQTRTENWHDYFQFLTWLLFPKAKAVINSIHIPVAKKRLSSGAESGRRTPIENMLSLFDEGGAVIVSSDESLLQLIRDFQWKELFWQRRNEVKENIQCIIFGHAMYEKALNPYIGMTANCILLRVEDVFLSKPFNERLAWIDDQISTIFKNGQEYRFPRDLSPLPLLGMPGWDSQNDYEAYYDNSDYFRPGRRNLNRKLRK